jgi:hypothetical protein
MAHAKTASEEVLGNRPENGDGQRSVSNVSTSRGAREIMIIHEKSYPKPILPS